MGRQQLRAQLECAAFALLATALVACHQPKPSREDKAEASAAEAEQVEQADLEHQTYEETRGSSDCTSDCSGHEAGWRYAKEHDLTDASQCSGDSQSFEEGCKAYIEEIEDAGDEAADKVTDRSPDAERNE